MQLVKPNLRLVALAAAVIGAVLLGSSLAPGSGRDNTFANTVAGLIGTSCSDIYLDLPPAQVKGTGPGPEDLAFPQNPLAKSITRLEPSKVNPGGIQVSTVTYLGPNLDGDPINFPDASPTIDDCQTKRADGKINPEANLMHPDRKFLPVGNKRPTSEGILVTKPGLAESVAQCVADNNTDDDADLYINDGCAMQGATAETGLQCINHVDDDADAGFVNDGCPIDGSANGAPVAGTYLRFSGCDFSPIEKQWVRTDVNSRVVDKTAQAQNYGYVTLYLGTSSPTFDAQGNPDPLTCNAVGSTAFPSIIDGRARQASTDYAAQVSPDVVADPDGVVDPGPPAAPPAQPPDGDTIPDDWDGDGCTDWDELAPKFKDDRSGRDPFNPNDCAPDSVADLTGTYNVLATAFPAAKQGRIIGPKTNVTSVGTKVIKGGKHVEADVNVVTPGALKQNQKVYWDTLDTPQVGWWQVTDNPSAGNPIHLARLSAPPCGLMTTGIPSPAMAAPGQLMGVACDGPVQSGNYFHCIARIDHLPANVLDSNILCYIDSPGLAIPGSPLKSDADGNAGPPPPPPYFTGGPSKLTGTYNPLTQQIHLTGCFANVGPPLGPNIIVDSYLDGKTLKGYTRIFGQQSIANCTAGTPAVKAGPPATSVLQVSTVLTRQNLTFDHDIDGCSDYNELGHGKAPPPPKDCGDDPYNPLDSDASYNSQITLSVTAVRADVCQGGLPAGMPPVGCTGAPNGAIAAGSYFHCVGDQQHAPPAKTFTTRLMCYTDNPVTTVNCQDAAGSTVNPCTAAVTCAPFGPANASRCGDGLPGITPPSNDPDGTGPGGSAYGDIDATHTQLAGTIDNGLNTLNISGCFNGVESPTQGPSIYTRAVINRHTGAGTVDIFLNQPANCTPLPVGEPPAPYDNAPIETAEQATKTGVTATNQNDTDLDGCSDKQELRDTQASGGRRDPYNRWDLLSVFTGSPPTRNKAVDTADISALVARFGATDTGAGTFDRNSNPTIAPAAPITPSGARANYHPAFDREGSLVGANPWNLKPANGNIGTGEISAVVAQFGHQCNT